jgi:hypothetical protein
VLNYSWKASPNRWGRPEFDATFSIGFGNDSELLGNQAALFCLCTTIYSFNTPSLICHSPKHQYVLSQLSNCILYRSGSIILLVYHHIFIQHTQPPFPQSKAPVCFISTFQLHFVQTSSTSSTYRYVLRMYKYILIKKQFTLHSNWAQSPLRPSRVSFLRLSNDLQAASCFSAVSSIVSPPMRGLPRPSCFKGAEENQEVKFQNPIENVALSAK